MAVRKIVPLLAGGAVVTAALAFAYTRRPVRASMPPATDGARFAPEQVGPDEGMVEVLSLVSGPHPTARNEAEAITGAGASWPLLESTEPSSAAGAEGMRVSAFQMDMSEASNDSADADRPTLTGTPLAPLGQGFAAVDPGEAFLDLEIEFEELETPTTDRDPSLLATDFPRERLEPYDSIAPEDLGTEWLARATEAPNEYALAPTELETERLRMERMDTLEDIGEATTIPATISAARRRLAEREEKAPVSGEVTSTRDA